ncbi:hypothetical protein PRJ_4594 [Pseudomonas sp. XWY-1]|nr:hypothetical protein PRJ_4594 [Pseudomonas sp. XWY-1]
MPASSRVNPHLHRCAPPVGAGSPAKRPAQQKIFPGTGEVTARGIRVMSESAIDSQ